MWPVWVKLLRINFLLQMWQCAAMCWNLINVSQWIDHARIKTKLYYSRGALGSGSETCFFGWILIRYIGEESESEISVSEEKKKTFFFISLGHMCLDVYRIFAMTCGRLTIFTVVCFCFVTASCVWRCVETTSAAGGVDDCRFNGISGGRNWRVMRRDQKPERNAILFVCSV